MSWERTQGALGLLTTSGSNRATVRSEREASSYVSFHSALFVWADRTERARPIVEGSAVFRTLQVSRRDIPGSDNVRLPRVCERLPVNVMLCGVDFLFYYYYFFALYVGIQRHISTCHLSYIVFIKTMI